MKPFRDNSLSKELDNVIALILENNDITRLLYHDTPDALSKPPLKVAEKRELINKRLFKRRTSKILSNDSGSFISLRLNHFRKSENNPNNLTHTLDVYIVCHDGVADINEGQRDLALVESISKVFYLQNVLGATKPDIVSIEDLIFDSNDFCGYVVSFGIVNEPQS